MNRAQVANWILSSAAALEPLPPASPPQPGGGVAGDYPPGQPAAPPTPSPAKPFGRRRGPPYDCVPLQDAEQQLVTLNPSQGALLRQRWPIPRVK